MLVGVVSLQSIRLSREPVPVLGAGVNKPSFSRRISGIVNSYKINRTHLKSAARGKSSNEDALAKLLELLASPGHSASSVAFFFGFSVDQLVGTREYNARHNEAESFRSFEVDHGFVPLRRLHRKVGWVRALENAIDVIRRLAVLVDK
jgi:hypothetical protein